MDVLCSKFFAYIYQYGCFGQLGRHLLFTYAQSEGYINGTTKASYVVGTEHLGLQQQSLSNPSFAVPNM